MRDDTTSQPHGLADRTATAHEELTAALAGRPLVNYDRHTSAGRVARTGPAPVAAFRPALALGSYSSWDAARASETLAAEDDTHERGGGDGKHQWWPVIADRAAARVADFPRPPVVAGWWAVPHLSDLAGRNGTVAGIPLATRHTIEDKAAVGHILRDAGVHDHMIIRARTYTGRHLPDPAVMRRDVGSRRLVVQSGHVGGGRGTVFVNGRHDMPRAAALPGPWRVSAFVEGWSSNTTVVSIPDGHGGVRVYVDRPSHNPMAITAVGIGPAKGAGNDWSSAWPASGVRDIIDAATRIGRWAWRTHRLVGIWGIDTIWTPHGPVINEINARRQGTTEVSGVNQLLTGFPPLVVAHLTTQLGHRVTWLPSPDDFNTTTLDSARGGKPAPYYLKIRARRRMTAPNDFPGAGIYRLTPNGLQWDRPGANPIQADSDTGHVLLANVPRAGTISHPGAEMGTVEGITAGPASPFGGPHDLSPTGRVVLAAFDRLFTHTEGDQQ
ncbi:hypothetical protein [Embleya scabrispora]|uniref:hypothetical protein n=1 Tax=Embleya scabrispora TaxID=159449 RepID=UPI00037BEA11|nr:hypothetical protein [Embleya scabrispora]MYS81037.1 hypothetical protein [Streptomyces sp. SID5474]